ncbi:SPOR domain-containing protein, partial [Thermodesulfobacteriota bacterium]
LGILVGRGFLPGTVTTISDLKGQIKKLQEMVSSKETFDSRSPKETDNAPELAFYEKLTSKKDDVIKNWKPEKDTDLPQKETPSEGVREPQNPPLDKEKKEALDTVKGVRKALISEARYTVQIASIGDVGKAEKMVRQLVEQGYDAYYYEASVKGKAYYRIRCGRFGSRAEAAGYARKLKEEAGLKGFVSRIE